MYRYIEFPGVKLTVFILLQELIYSCDQAVPGQVLSIVEQLNDSCNRMQ